MAFIAPGLVKAAVKGWLPPGIGSRRRKMPKLEGQPAGTEFSGAETGPRNAPAIGTGDRTQIKR
jgi:hypothetical protein